MPFQAPPPPRSRRARAKGASPTEKDRILKWLVSLEEWPSSAMLEEYVTTHVEKNDRTYYRDDLATTQEAATRLHTILCQVRKTYLRKDGSRSFKRAEMKFWKDHLMRILSAPAINADPVLWQIASRIFKLPAGAVDKHFAKRKLKYVMGKEDGYEMALERCPTCKTKTKVIGGRCILSSHQERVLEIKQKKALEKKQFEAAKNKRRKMTYKCGCWAVLRPGQSVAVVDVKNINGRIISSDLITTMDPDSIVAAGAAGK